METGAVSFHKPNEVMFIKIEKDAAIVKQISKTKIESYPDLKKQLEEHKSDISEKEREAQRKLMAQTKEEKKVQLAK